MRKKCILSKHAEKKHDRREKGEEEKDKVNTNIDLCKYFMYLVSVYNLLSNKRNHFLFHDAYWS